MTSGRSSALPFQHLSATVHFLGDLWGIKPTWSLWSFSARDHGDDIAIRGTMEGLLSGSKLEQKRMMIRTNHTIEGWAYLYNDHRQRIYIGLSRGSLLLRLHQPGSVEQLGSTVTGPRVKVWDRSIDWIGDPPDWPETKAREPGTTFRINKDVRLGRFHVNAEECLYHTTYTFRTSVS